MSAPSPRNLYYRSYGGPHSPSPPLLLLHGLSGSSANWHGIATRLSREQSVIAVDLRNHGRSPWDAAMGCEEMAADLAALVDDLGAGPVTLTGHSMGGKAAMWLALTRPENPEPVSGFPRRSGPPCSAFNGTRYILRVYSRSH